MNSNGQTYSHTFKSCLHKNLDQSRFFLSKEMLVSRSGLAIFLFIIILDSTIIRFNFVRANNIVHLFIS